MGATITLGTGMDGLTVRYAKNSKTRVLVSYLEEGELVRIPGTTEPGQVVSVSTTNGYTTVIYCNQHREDHEGAFAVRADTWFTLI